MGLFKKQNKLINTEDITKKDYKKFIKRIQEIGRFDINVYLFLILFSLGHNKKIFDDYVKQFSKNKELLSLSNRKPLNDYLEGFKIYFEDHSNGIEVLQIKLQQDKFSCHINLNDLTGSFICILDANKEKNKDYLLNKYVYEGFTYYDLYNITQTFLIRKLEKYYSIYGYYN